MRLVPRRQVLFESALILGVAMLSRVKALAQTIISRVPAAAGWKIKVTTTTSPQDFKVGLTIPSGTFTIDWGDGSKDAYTTTSVKVHSYATAGTYIMRMTGNASLIDFYTSATPTLVIEIMNRVNGITGLTSFSSTFRDCTGITSIPSGLFDTCGTGLTASAFLATFRGCTGITSIPTDLFRYNTAVTTSAFYHTFYGCTGLTSIPTDLFRYNTLVTTYAFYNTFRDCTGLTSIPTDLFRYNKLVTTGAFVNTFLGCSKITGIPVDLFDWIGAGVETLEGTFQGCTLLVGNVCSLTLNTAVTNLTWAGSKFDGWTASTIANTLKTFSLLNAKLTVAAVNQLLVDFDATDTATGTLNVGSVTNATPTAGPPNGTGAVDSLRANSWTVTCNNY